VNCVSAFIIRQVWFGICSILVLLGTGELAVRGYASEILVLQSAALPIYEQAVHGLKAELADSAQLVEFDMQGDLARGRQLARRTRASSTALVVAVGVKAALAAKLEIFDIPIIFCMVFDPVASGLNTPNMTGITLQIPIAHQLTTFHAVLPERKRIGVLYNPENTGALLDESRRQATPLGIEIVARPVSSGKDVPATLRALLSQIDVLWLLPDSTVLTEDSLRFLLGSALDANVPVVGFSSELVRSGALVGLYVDYEEIGRQAGKLVERMLHGAARPSPPSVFPEQLRLALNLKTAKFLGITIPPEVVSRADIVY
jgi:putative ABC transport system substrate-binding protein